MIPSGSGSDSLYQSVLTQIIAFSHPPFIHHPQSDKLAIILDPRYDATMKGVIRNFMYFMNPKGWNLMIISYSGYVKTIQSDFPTALVTSIEDSWIEFKPLKNSNGTMESSSPSISIDTYNHIFLDIKFWKGFREPHICIFQRDCIMYKIFPEYFLNYDFAGANYYKKEHCGFLYGGINGGFSLRNRQAMIDCLEKINWEKIVEYRKGVLLQLIDEPIITPYLDTTNEDVFFTLACEMLHKDVPDKLHRTFLSIEADWNLETCVYHGWHHNYHDVTAARQLLKKSELFSRFFHPVYSEKNAD